MKVQDLINAIFFAAALQGLMLAFVFQKRSKDQAYRYLSMIFLSFSFVLLYWVAYWADAFSGFSPGIGQVLDPLDLLIGPFVYFFVRSLINDKFYVSKAQWVHFMPFVLFSVIAICRFFTLDFGLFDQVDVRYYLLFYNVSKNVQFCFYLVWLIIQLVKHSNRWLYNIGLLLIVFFFGRLLYTILALNELITPMLDYGLSCIMTGAIYLLAYSNQLEPILLRGKKNYANSSLSHIHEPLICEKVLNHIQSNKKYLDHEYSIGQLSEELSIPRHHVSQALNQHLKKSFSTLINELRVEESKLILSDPERMDTKIMNVAFESGFSNKVSFNQYFKKSTGKSPAEYRKTCMQIG